ncbi:uncharacterized protein [Diadema setosum]|uniref:uncharacterized protein n=1 Tax=Diadema setosum TaxID=31175 RepID=UPI003B3B696F
MNIKCYEATPSVKLVGGPSPLDGLVVLDSERYVCYDDFNVRAADVVCRELGFPAVEDYSAQITPSAATLNRVRWLSYSQGCQSTRVQDCLSKRTECPWNKAVRLRCREPGFLGCYQGDRRTFQVLDVNAFNVYLDGECVSACRRNPENHDIAIINDRNCICYRSEEYANLISDVSYTHYWTPENKVESKPSQQVHCLFNLSVGYCKHPGHVSDGYWDSNITGFGSKMTLTCGEGFVSNDIATLQCDVRLPGWSTYFPVWNASVPSCRAVDITTNDDERHDPDISTTRSQITDGTSSEWQSTEQLTTLQLTDSMTTSVSGHPRINGTVGLYTLGTFLFVVLILLVILFVSWRKHYNKRKRSHPENSNKSSTHPINTDAMHRPLSEHQGNKTGDATAANQEEMHHIYQNSAEDHTLEGEVVNNLPDAISRPLRDVMLHREGEDIAQYQDITSNVKKELYMDMAGNVKKKEDVKSVQSRNSSTSENEIENGYMISNVSPRRPTRFKQEKTSYINNVTSFGHEINRDMSIQFRPADNDVRCEVSEWSVYKDVLSTSNQSAPIREPQHGTTENHSMVPQYATIERNEKRDPLAIGLYNSLYSVTIYSTKQKEERDLDENGYLVLEACSGEIAGDQYVEMDKEVLIKASLYEDMLFPQNKSP